jgi:hypothetical protein
MPYVIDNTKPWLGKALAMSVVVGILGFWIGILMSQSPTVSDEPSPIETTIEETYIEIPIEETTQPDMTDMPLAPLPDISFGSDDDDEYEDDEEDDD